MPRVSVWLLACGLFCAGGAAHAVEPADNLRDLMQRLEAERRAQAEAEAGEEETLRAARDKAAERARDAAAKLRAAEAEAARLEQRFRDNEQKLVALEALWQERLGAYGELFGLMRLRAQDMSARWEASFLAVQYPAQAAQLAALAEQRGLPTEQDLDALWQAMQQEIKAQSEVARFAAPLRLADGAQKEMPLVRLGPFTLLQEGEFVRALGAGRLGVLARQPAWRFRAAADDFLRAPADVWAAGVIDPSRGALLQAFGRAPDWRARLRQGGPVGYVIVLLGGFGIGFALWRLAQLYRQRREVRAQKGALWERLPAAPSAQGQAQLDATLTPFWAQLERGLPLLRLLAGIAPLLGLLGTVTGLIVTFQAMSLFGSGDVRLMAGGISQALVTTVLGLSMAIPLLLLHNLAQAWAQDIMQRLEEHALKQAGETGRG